jgi:minor extracellular serine protease Vpr
LFVLRRLLVLVSMVSLILPTTVSAQDPVPTTEPVVPVVLPEGADDSATVTVMVELAGEPVAVVEAEAGRELSEAEEDAIEADLEAAQDAITDDIAAEGGTVLSQIQNAYNGIRVEIARGDAASLATLPGVVGVRGLQVFHREMATSVPFLGVPSVWQSTGFTGEGIRVGIIDTGLDYTHANFGGPGTEAAFDAADATDTAPADPALFGPNAPKVKGGFDFAGDDYNASADPGDPALIPQPDPNPLDCASVDGGGHGSHVGGTTGGFGVLADGSTYPGPYDETTHTRDFEIGPGVAPEVDLYALRVFGCTGSTDVTVEAIDWAVDNDLHVINMSLGSSFGRHDDPTAVAASNAAASGVVVVTSSGNSGPNPYITGSPGTADGSIATAAIDSWETFPAATLNLASGPITAINANDAELPTGSIPIHVLRNPNGTVSLGCNGIGPNGNPVPGSTPGEYEAQNVEGKIVVTVRGTCARVARAVHAQRAGAAGVIMVDTSTSFPPFEGKILGNPDVAGDEEDVTIPFLGVRGVLGPNPTADGDNVVAADGQSITLTGTTIANPGFRGFASFSSGGPRNGDSGLKPNISAPGVAIKSTNAGTGSGGRHISGTSMASPHVAGVAAMVKQAHPDWSVDDIGAAIQNHADPSGMAGYKLTRGGAGLVDAAGSVGTQVVALGDRVRFRNGQGDRVRLQTATLSYGFADLGRDFRGNREITIRNHGSAPVTLALGSEASPQSVAASVSFDRASITVPAGGERKVRVTLRVAAAATGTTMPQFAGDFRFFEASGNVTLTAGGTVLRVPYLLVPRSSSDIEASARFDADDTSTTARVTNRGGAIAGNATFYTWGLEDRNDVDEEDLGGSGYDVRAVGVRSQPLTATIDMLTFAINHHDRFSTGSVNEWHISVDANRDGTVDWILVAIDSGVIRTGSFNGLLETFLVRASDGATFAANPPLLPVAPTDNGTLLVQVPTSFIGVTPTSGGFTYSVETFSLEGDGEDAVDGTALYDPWNQAIEDSQTVTVAPRGSANVPVALNPTAFAAQRPLGIMVVGLDNEAGRDEAELIEVRGRGGDDDDDDDDDDD